MKVNINDRFWKPRIDRMCNEIIPYQYKVLNDEVEGIPPSHAIGNFRLAAGEEKGTYGGMLFQDSDVGKWIEAAAYALAWEKNPILEEEIDGLVCLMKKAQGEDGYLNTYYTCKKPGERFANIAHGHELYCAGHLLEGAVAYARVTGKEEFLHIMINYIGLLQEKIGREHGQMRIYPGHPELEIALYKLYQYTGEEKYLEFMEYFIEERGSQPSFLEKDSGFGEQFKDKWFDLKYHQAHEPVKEQKEAAGHAVRAMYLYAAMADLAGEKGDEDLKQSLQVLWNDVTGKKMYLTGAVGSEAHGECFSAAYDLPNDRAYAETCASIGLIFWAKRMLRMEKDSKYGDVMERALYNGAISGISEDGKKYFYVNPLMMLPEEVETRYDLQHVSKERTSWFGCACCPPNVARLMASLGEYIYEDCYGAKNPEEGFYIHLYVEGEVRFGENGKNGFVAEGDYIKDGRMKYTYKGEKADKEIYFRIPSWCECWEIRLNDERLMGRENLGEGREEEKLKKGYAAIDRQWQEGDTVDVAFGIKPRLVYANPKVWTDAGRCALMRGPVVYCLEEKENGKNLNAIVVKGGEEWAQGWKEEQGYLYGEAAISFPAKREDVEKWGNTLYCYEKSEVKEIKAVAIPYHSWGNRGCGEMVVWMRTE